MLQDLVVDLNKLVKIRFSDGYELFIRIVEQKKPDEIDQFEELKVDTKTPAAIYFPTSSLLYSALTTYNLCPYSCGGLSYLFALITFEPGGIIEDKVIRCAFISQSAAFANFPLGHLSFHFL